MAKKLLTMEDILSEDCLCGVCKGYLSIPPIVYAIKLAVYVCGRCYDEEMYSTDIVIRQEDYEKTASPFLFPCSNDDCDERVEFGEHAKFHEKICVFAQIKCPISNFFRGFLKPGEIPCFFRCTEESRMIEHIRLNHSDYILPSPQMIRSSDVLMDSAKRRMYIMIFINEYQYKMAVLTREKTSRKMMIRCRTIMDEHQYCIVGIQPPINDTIQCFSCVQLDRPRYERDEDDEVYTIRFSHFRKQRTLGFRIEETDVSLMGEHQEILIDAIRSLTSY